MYRLKTHEPMTELGLERSINKKEQNNSPTLWVIIIMSTRKTTHHDNNNADTTSTPFDNANDDGGSGLCRFAQDQGCEVHSIYVYIYILKIKLSFPNMFLTDMKSFD